MSTLTARVFALPDLGEGLTEAGLVQWLVAVGDRVAVDQAIAEVETAKSVVELPSPFAGVVTALHGEAGDTIAVGAPVLEVAEEGAAFEEHRTEERAGSGNVLIGYGTTERPHAGRRRAPRGRVVAESTRSATPLASDAPAPPAPAPPSPSAGRTGPVAVRSPLVRRLARDLGVDVRLLVPTGPDGAVTRADVLRAAVDQAVDAPASLASPERPSSDAGSAGERIDGLVVARREPLSPLRKAASARLGRSRSEIPEATVWVDVDATRLWDLRAEIAASGDRAPSLTALLARFVLLALEEHPVLASRLTADGAELVSFEGVNLGVAVDTDRGLMVPVIPHAHALTVAGLDAALRDVADTARSGRVPAERLAGSTFTFNNYGALGVDGSAAIINHPDVAILGIGRLLERPWVVDGQLVARRIAQLSLVFDHRVCDGGYAASFLRRLVGLIEQPLRAYGRV
ncbi:dihydrolipoamide acetyltransferase family protein [uncultured Microbacterium sp.]|uniref:dihydrolipoamide acetyltransferase family protein n=1 Tax=uncultured Microbacterium sp. TaxID=191216 RepID=UPI0028DB34C1|nr:dihydrolipoamide acetyltransferase family protein [uncultured Microbacterium sp.]